MKPKFIVVTHLNGNVIYLNINFITSFGAGDECTLIDISGRTIEIQENIEEVIDAIADAATNRITPFELVV